MMPPGYILKMDDPQCRLESVGGKGASLARLLRAGLPVPGGFHVTTEAYRTFVAANGLQPLIQAALQHVDASEPATLEAAAETIWQLFSQAPIPVDIAEAIVQAYAALPGANPAVAVRSSATAEDLPEASFAGQQETYLNISGPAALLEASRKCWASLWAARAIGYRMRHRIPAETVALAVIVQQMVPSEAAGVLFTANPVNGRRDQAVINAAWGLGEAVVGGLVTPDEFTVDKVTGQVMERHLAEKQVMGVRTPGGTEEQPVPQSLRRAPVLSDEQAAELTRLAVRAERLYGMPQDVEWVLAEGKFAILQARPITALPAPELPTPTVWKLPRGAYIAMRNNIVELMPDPLTPLFGTLGLAAINASLGRQMTSFFGRPGVVPNDLIITVNAYAYYNGSLTAGQIAGVLLGSVGIAKRMFTGAVERWHVGRPVYVATVERWQARPWREQSAAEILSAVRELAEAAIDAYGALVSRVIPAAWISEGLFTVTYDTLIKRCDDPPAPTYLLGFDSIPIRAEKSLYGLAEWAHGRPGLAAYLTREPASQLAAQLGSDLPPPDVNPDEWREWQSRFRAHLQRYGHAIYNLDFANTVPADDPAPLLETCKLFIAGQGVNPYTRQQATAERRDQATRVTLSRQKGWRLKVFRRLLASAQRYAPLREDGLADIGLSYPLQRQMLRELGRRYVQAEVIDEPNDIFWLTQDEVEQAAARLDHGEALSHLSEAIPQRKAAWRAARRATPPRVLPQLKFLGRDLARRKRGRTTGDTLQGVAASPGRVTATARVILGPEQFSQMKRGDVLVAAITTPAWTPLFAMASAIVTDVGGPLSHGSIVAREYGLPAVLGTQVATKSIRSGDMITVDGSEGNVYLKTTGATNRTPDLDGGAGHFRGLGLTSRAV